MAKRILLVDDEPLIIKGLKYTLEQEGYETLAAYDGEEALEVFFANTVDLVLLDVMLPKLDGIQVCQRIRESSNVPIIMLTAKGEDMDKILGLEYGADDYMTKPFSPAELLAHLRALTRRQGDVVFETLTVGDLTLNLESMDLTCGDESIRLSQKEFAIARILLGSPGAVLSKEQLISRAWGPSSSASDNNVEAYISFLRKKMAHVGSKAKIETIRSVGYRLAEEG